MTALRRALAVPPFADDPDDLIGLGVAAEQAGFEASSSGITSCGATPGRVRRSGSLADPGLVAARTSRSGLGTMDHPVPRQAALAAGQGDRHPGPDQRRAGHPRVGLGSPAYATFGIFHEPALGPGACRALDEGLGRCWPGCGRGTLLPPAARTSHLTRSGSSPVPVQQPRIPVWVGGGCCPPPGPVRRACRWDGIGAAAPLGQPARRCDAGRAHPGDIAAVRDQAWFARGTPRGLRPGGWGRAGGGSRRRGPGGAGLTSRPAPPGGSRVAVTIVLVAAGGHQLPGAAAAARAGREPAQVPVTPGAEPGQATGPELAGTRS